MRTVSKNTCEVYINTQDFTKAMSSLTGLSEKSILRCIGRHTPTEVFGEHYISTITAKRATRGAIARLSRKDYPAETMRKLLDFVELLAHGAENQSYSHFIIELHVWGLRITDPDFFI